VALSLMSGPLFAQNSAPGATRIAKWKDDKKAPFMMMFDDCCPTHVTNVFPELQKRGMTGTYYIVNEKPERKARLEFWEKEAPGDPTVVFANHTVNHKALTDLAQAEQEIAGCNELIYRVSPGKNPRLISYATPGGPKHEVSEEQLKDVFARQHLILRPPFGGHGGGIHFKTGDDVLAAIDKAVVSGQQEYVIFHGVGGDWISFPMPEFVAMLDGLEKRRDELWITDHISVHKYESERNATQVETAEASPKKIILTVKNTTDAALYDLPLTFVTKVPAGWKACTVTQDGKATKVAVVNGEAKFEALPVNGSIQLEPVS
jgi:hypothetical protein